MDKENTGFRNGNLFCFNCGESQVMPTPMRLELATDFMRSFSNLHQKCPKTWEEPKNLNAETNEEKKNCAWWSRYGEHGISSVTMFNILSDSRKIKAVRTGTPSDPDDFRRCHLLLENVPQFRAKLERMKAVNKTWANLVDNWEELTTLLKEQMLTKKPNGMYDLMKKLGC